MTLADARNELEGVGVVLDASAKEEAVRKMHTALVKARHVQLELFAKGLRNPRIASDAFGEIAMDGAKQLVKATEAAHKRASGDGWHHGKCRVKGFRGHVEGFVVRPKPSAVEKAQRCPSPAPSLPAPSIPRGGPIAC